MAQEQEKLTLLRDLKELLEKAPERVPELLENVHEADVADWLQDLDEEDTRTVFRGLSIERRADVLEFAEDALRQELLGYLDPKELTVVVQELPADEGVDVLALVDESLSEEVLRSVDDEREAELRALRSFDADTAGGVMSTDFTVARAGTRIGDVIKEIKHEGKQAEEGVGVFVVDADERPVGYLSDRSLLTHSIHDGVEEVMAEPFLVKSHQDQEEAANLIHKYSLQALAVVDDAGRLIGIIATDEAQDVLEEEASEDIHRIVGTSAAQQTRLPILTRVRHRIPLQALTVVGGLVTAMILNLVLDSDVHSNASLLRFVPIVIGLAGNVGIQASTILVRAFATGEVEPDRELSVLSSEVIVGLLIGLLCGAATVPVAASMQGGGVQGMLFGSSVGLAIATAVTWAAFLGCVVPMGCRRAGIDPAVVAGPFLITLSDVSGTAIFVGVAMLIRP